jgi:hypothetical protein
MEAVILLPSFYKSDNVNNVLELLHSLDYFRGDKYRVMVYLQNYPDLLLNRIKEMFPEDGFIFIENINKPLDDPKSFTNRNIRHKAYELASELIIKPYYNNNSLLCHNIAIIHIDDDFLFNKNSVQYYDKAVELVRSSEEDYGLVKVNNRKKEIPDGTYTDEFLWTSAGLVHYDDGNGIFEEPCLDMKMGGDDLAIFLKFIKRGSRFISVNGADIETQPEFLTNESDDKYDDPSDQWRERGNHEIIEHYMKELGLEGNKEYNIQNHKIISINFIHKYLRVDNFIDELNRELILNE